MLACGGVQELLLSRAWSYGVLPGNGQACRPLGLIYHPRWQVATSADPSITQDNICTDAVAVNTSMSCLQGIFV
jgi:hypothetical protein